LGVEDAGIRLNDTDSLIVRLNSEELTIAIAQNCSEVQPQVLGVKLRGKAVAETLLATSRNLDIVASSSQVAENTGISLRIGICAPETATNEVDSNGACLVVRIGEKGLGWAAIDKLDAKYLSSREGRGHQYVKYRRLRRRFKVDTGVLSERSVGSKVAGNLLAYRSLNSREMLQGQ
jgi:hypothetical protein